MIIVFYFHNVKLINLCARKYNLRIKSRNHMGQIENDFVSACQVVEQMYTRLGNSTVRKVYALYKQATVGDVTGKRPGVLRIRDRIKFDSWSSISGMSKDDAKLAYIGLVKNLSFENEEISCDEREARLNVE